MYLHKPPVIGRLRRKKMGMQKKARNIARRPNAFWTREIKRLGGGFFRMAPVFYILCAERFRDARGALFERTHYTDADHLFCRCY